MEFGVQFFPSVGPETKSAQQYFDEALRLTVLAETLGYTNVRTVEHYFHPYGGYSPNPIVFLAAAAADDDDAPRHRRGAPGVQPPAQARR